MYFPNNSNIRTNTQIKYSEEEKINTSFTSILKKDEKFQLHKAKNILPKTIHTNSNCQIEKKK